MEEDNSDTSLHEIRKDLGMLEKAIADIEEEMEHQDVEDIIEEKIQERLSVEEELREQMRNIREEHIAQMNELTDRVNQLEELLASASSRDVTDEEFRRLEAQVEQLADIMDKIAHRVS